MADGDATGQAPVTESKRSKRDGREAYCPQLEWLIVMGDSSMGERGTLGGTIAVLEHGGQFSGVPNTDIYSDAQIGWHRSVVGLVERHRWLSAAWRALPVATRARLRKVYTAPPAEFRSDEGFGARDHCPRVEEIENDRTIEPSKPSAFHNRRGTEARLGRYAALAFELCEDPAALLIACQDPNRGKASRVINRALKLAREAAVADHELWFVAMAQAAKPRTTRERVALQPEFDPHGSDSE